MAEEKKEKKPREKIVFAVYPALPKSTKEVNADYVIAYCKANKKVKWLQSKLTKYGPKWNTIIRVFNEEFFAPMVDTEKASKKSKFDEVMALIADDEPDIVEEPEEKK